MRLLRLTLRDATAPLDAPVDAFAGGGSGVESATCADAYERIAWPSAAPDRVEASWSLRRGPSRLAAAVGLAALSVPAAAPLHAQVASPFTTVEQTQEGAREQATDAGVDTNARPAATAAPASDSDDRLMRALIGHRAELELTEGRRATGQVLSVEDGVFVLALEPSMQLVTLSSADVVAARLMAPALVAEVEAEPETKNRSTALMATGIATTAIGATMFVTWMFPSVLFGYSASSLATAAGVGAGLVAAGVPMWIIGGRNVEVTPTVAYEALGDRAVTAYGGLRFAF